MTELKILDNAPEGATHTETLASTKVYYLKKDKNGMGYSVFLCDKWTSSMAVTGYVRSLSDIKRIAELEAALMWSRDNNTGSEPSISVMQRYYDDLLPAPPEKGQ